MSNLRILNLIEEARYAIKAGNWARAEELLAEARTLVAFERRLENEVGA